MHSIEPTTLPADGPADSRPWWRMLNRYHWFVLFVAALGWMFDCFDQQLFVLARSAVMEDLVKPSDDTPASIVAQMRRDAANTSTSVFMLGWAVGGLVFGKLGDRIGRAKTMTLTILLYSLFTGLSALSTSVWDFAFYRFLTGLGVGGEFAVGVALVAEVMPPAARAQCLGALQALSTVGNITAASINYGLGISEESGGLSTELASWQIMFLIGALPALLALVVRMGLKEPEQWKKQAAGTVEERRKLGSYWELLSHPVWRKHAILGMLLGCAGVVGVWAIGFFSVDLMRSVQMPAERDAVIAAARERAADDEERAAVDKVAGLLRNPTLSKEGFSASELKLHGEMQRAIGGRLARWQSLTSMALNFGAFFGMFGFGTLAQRIGRRPAFAITLIAACITTICVFAFLKDLWQIFVLVPMMGFCQLALFAGYAIYFPELFPTSLRSTGTSFCYNVGRVVAALGPLAKSFIEQFFVHTDAPVRYAGMCMCAVFLLGLVVLPFLPETKGKPLPE